MFNNFKIFAVELAMFEGGAAPAAAGTASASAGTAGEGETQAGRANTQHGTKKGALSNVVYGKQPEETAVPAASEQEKTAVQTNTLEDRRKAFNDLVNGEYKDIYTQETQRIIDRRFKETKTLQAQVDSAAPILETLMQHYNIADGDMAKLLSAVENDNTYWQDAAYEAGMDVEQYKKFKKLERENEALLKAERDRKGRAQADAQVQQWYSEAEQIAAKYPDFNLNEEVKNPSFLQMLRSGVPMEHAYRVTHFDELMNNNANAAAAQAEKRMVDNIRAKGRRPAENGTHNQSAFTVKDDVSKLSKSDRAEIVRRVTRGEKIVF